ncbi:MAG: hypothetical protein ACLFSY_01575 [Desulfonatronovibrionaceae bacterium]
MKTPERLTIESMTHCEAEVVTKVLNNGNILDRAIKMLEGLRLHRFQAVVWDEEERYMGGTWFNPIRNKWTAEFMDMEWNEEGGEKEVLKQVLEIG